MYKKKTLSQHSNNLSKNLYFLIFVVCRRDKEVIDVNTETRRRISEAQVEYQVNKQMKNFTREEERRRSTCQVAEQLISDAEDHLKNVQKRIVSNVGNLALRLMYMCLIST